MKLIFRPKVGIIMGISDTDCFPRDWLNERGESAI
jgi:hypothetical protein